MTTKQSRRKSLVLAITVIVLAVLAWYVTNNVSLEKLAYQEDRIRSLIAINPLRSFLVGFGIYTALSLVPGTGGKAIVYGWLFGFWQALIIVSTGLTLTGIVIFSLSRYLFQASIERRYTHFVSLMNKHIEKEGAFYLLALRMAHFPFSIVNPVSGASRVGIWTFFWTTAIGLLPANAIWVYLGTSLPSLRDLADNGPEAFITLPLITALVALALLPLLIRWLVSRFEIPASDSDASDTGLDNSERDIL